MEARSLGTAPIYFSCWLRCVQTSHPAPRIREGSHLGRGQTLTISSSCWPWSPCQLPKSLRWLHITVSRPLLVTTKCSATPHPQRLWHHYSRTGRGCFFLVFNSSSGGTEGQTEGRTTRLEQWFSTGGDFMPPGDILQYLESLLVLYIYTYMELLWWVSGKESACHTGGTGLIPGLGRSPEEGNGNPT